MCTITRLSPFLAQHFGWDYKEHVPQEIAYNNYHCGLNIINNPDKFPKANFEYLSQQCEEIFLYWPEVLFTTDAGGK